MKSDPKSSPSLDDLVGDFLQGDCRVADEIENRIGGWVFHLISKWIRQQQDREDVYQEVFLTLFQKLHQFQLGTSFPAWTQTIVRHKIGDYIKKSRRNHSHYTSPELLDLYTREVEELDVDMERLDRCISRLSETQQAVLYLKYKRGLTYEVVGAQLGITGATAKWHETQALERLSRLFEQAKWTTSFNEDRL